MRAFRQKIRWRILIRSNRKNVYWHYQEKILLILCIFENSTQKMTQTLEWRATLRFDLVAWGHKHFVKWQLFFAWQQLLLCCGRFIFLMHSVSKRNLWKQNLSTSPAELTGDVHFCFTQITVVLATKPLELNHKKNVETAGDTFFCVRLSSIVFMAKHFCILAGHDSLR